jgi:hypothetical protein
MRKRLIEGLDSLFRHYVWLCLSPLGGCAIASVVAWFLWPETLRAGFVAMFAGGVIGTVLGLVLMRILKARFHPWVIAQLTSMQKGPSA